VDPQGLSTFLASAGFAYIAAMLLASGAGHLRDIVGFRDLVRAHAILPPRVVSPGVFCVLAFELGGGATALLLATQQRPAVAPAAALCVATAGAGLGFVSYLRRLLRTSSAAPCGCSPFSGPTTPASLMLGAALVLASVVALVATLALELGPAADRLDGIAPALASLWGVTLAALTMLVPATMPEPATSTPVSS
jgi:hypothetical protein